MAEKALVVIQHHCLSHSWVLTKDPGAGILVRQQFPEASGCAKQTSNGLQRVMLTKVSMKPDA